MSFSKPLSDSDLIVNSEKRIYHLDLRPEELSPNIIIVGDPNRANFIAEKFFDSIEVKREHRGLVSATGRTKLTGQRVTVVTSGMGTPSLEIVLQEIVALVEIDFDTRLPKAKHETINIIRVGTSGGIQAKTPLGSLIISSYVIGMDNTGQFYETSFVDQNCERMEVELANLFLEMAKHSRFKGYLRPYVTKSNDHLRECLVRAAERSGINYKIGLTASNSGFFANQGRNVCRIPPSVKDLDQVLASYNPGVHGEKVENLEMEASFLCHFMNGLGHRAAAICPTIANRVEETFDQDYQQAVESACCTAIAALSEVEKL